MLPYPTWLGGSSRSSHKQNPRTPKHEQKSREGGRSSKQMRVNELLKLMPKGQERPDDRMLFKQSSGAALKKLIGSLKALDRMGTSRTPVAHATEKTRSRVPRS